MGIPGFDEFIGSLDTDTLGTEIDNLLPLRIIQGQNLTETESKLAAVIYQRAFEDSLKVSLLYLRKYHEWLQEQI